MEIKRIDEYEKPKFNTFQLKTGKMLATGAACLALLGISSTGGCTDSPAKVSEGGIVVSVFTTTLDGEVSSTDYSEVGTVTLGMIPPPPICHFWAR